MKISIPAFIVIPVVALLAGCNVNKDISVPAQAHWSSGSSTINGEITVGAGAIVDGGLRTINGSISVSPNAQVGDLTTINGTITLSDNVHAGELKGVNATITLGKQVVTNGTVESVNGDIRAGSGSHIQGDLRNVNGGITLCNTQVTGKLAFYNGTVQVAQNSVVQGDITAKKPNGTGNERVPILIVGPGAHVGGTISFERPGELYVSDSAVVHAVQGVTPVKFSGATPAKIPAANCPNT
ncbi:MAG: hypothetical protein ACRETA_07900 [Gammaproteobacteria bacterium]